MSLVQLAGREVQESSRHPSQHLCSAFWVVLINKSNRKKCERLEEEEQNRCGWSEEGRRREDALLGLDIKSTWLAVGR